MASLAPDRPGSVSGLEQDQRDLPISILLVAAISGLLLDDYRPEPIAFRPGGDAGDHRHTGCSLHGDRHLRVLPQVQEPGRVGVLPAF